jgi:hypothetical protein
MSWTKPAPRVRQWEGPTPTSRTFVLRRDDGEARATVSVPKTPPKRSETYRRWVATLACAHCKKAGPSQCAHADEGKGMALKADDETCFPLCPACHTGIGAQGWFTKSQRRHLETTYGACTRLKALAEGKFPAGWGA